MSNSFTERRRRLPKKRAPQFTREQVRDAIEAYLSAGGEITKLESAESYHSDNVVRTKNPSYGVDGPMSAWQGLY